ncbi:MAG: hypothetical protein QOG64_1890, partial [Acidimicrobiaceae bacterium]|nr:hypothetical protein [Acidimicrobiaceae bacterium]
MIGMIRSRSTPVTTDHGGLDRTGWIVLVIVFLSIFVLALDTTIVTVAVPTILREFDTNLPSVQWVITGYSLTFATFLIIGGRLGDVFGHRRVFAVGTALFGFGSFLAAISSSVAMLILGEAVIEGIGAALMLPATVAILSNRFTGAERATAFTAWGAATGTAVAFGPAVGGFLTTNFSWRWAFGINVVVAPLAILGALLFMKDGERTPGPRPQIDIGGAVLLATGMFLLVFGLSEGGTYGWLHSRARVVLGGVGIWPAGWALSVIPGAFLGALVVLTTFYFNQRGKERMGREALFEFGQLRHLGFRYGLLTTGGLAMGQHGMQFVLPVFLQDGLHLSAQRNGLWQLPIGITVIVAAQVGARLVRLVGPSAVV